MGKTLLMWIKWNDTCHSYRVCFYEVMSFILKITILICTEANLFLSAFHFIYIDNETIQDMDVHFNKPSARNFVLNI